MSPVAFRLRCPRLILLVAAATVVGCENEVGPIELPPAASVEIADGAGQSAEVGSTLAVAPAVQVRDSAGRPIKGVEVHFVARRGSIANATARTNSNGIASAGTWRLPERSGLDTIVASVTGVTPRLITAVARPGAAVALNVLNPTGFERRVLEAMDLPVFQVVDRFGNGVGDVYMTLGVIDNDGTMPTSRVAPVAEVTDDFGIVGATSWLPYVVGNHRLGASTAIGGFSAIATRHVREDACGARHVVGVGVTRTFDLDATTKVAGCGDSLDVITVVLTSAATLTVQASPRAGSPVDLGDVRTAWVTRAPAWSPSPQVLRAPTTPASQVQFTITLQPGNYDVRVAMPRAMAARGSTVQLTVASSSPGLFARSR